MTKTEMEKMLDLAADQLGEHFECVQILVSTGAEEGGTRRYFVGAGNWYARQGMAHAFIKADEADDLSSKIAEKLEE